MSLNDLDDYLFPLETNSLDDSLYLEPPFPFCVETTVTNHIEPQIPTPFVEPSNLMYPFHSTNEQIATSMPTPSSTPRLSSMTNSIPSFDTFGSGWVYPFDPIDQLQPHFTNNHLSAQEKEQEWSFFDKNIPTQVEEVQPPSKIQSVVAAQEKQEAIKETLDQLLSPCSPPSGGSLELKMPIDMDLTKLCSNLTNASKELKSHDPEALKYFLAGTVRPGPDVVHIYKCELCCLEFPNAQAFGGHMSSHSKKREKGNMSKKLKHRSRKKPYKSTTNMEERKHVETVQERNNGEDVEE